MEYIVLGQDGKEYGPVDGETLKKWVEHGRVFKDTQIRNALMKKWNEAGKIDILQEAFEIQQIHEEQEEGVGGKLFGMLGLKSDHEVAPEREVNTAFKYKYIPNPASAGQRIGAFIIDGFIMAFFALILFLFMNISAGTTAMGTFSYGADTPLEETLDEEIEETSEEKAEEVSDEVSETVAENEGDLSDEEIDEESGNAAADIPEPFVPTDDQIKKLNSSFNSYFFIFITGVFLYYGICLGIFAQTYGMWFWGLIIVKGYQDECFPARALAFTVGMIVIGIVTPLVVLINPQHRSLHGYLSGTRLIRIAAKPKV